MPENNKPGVEDKRPLSMEDKAREFSAFLNSLTPSELWELCPEFFA